MPGATYDAQNRLVQIGDKALTYDREGRVIAYGSRPYEWDGPRLLTESFGDGAAPMRYRYDPNGRLMSVAAAAASIEMRFEGDRLMSVTSSAKDEVRTSAFRYDCR